MRRLAVRFGVLLVLCGMVFGAEPGHRKPFGKILGPGDVSRDLTPDEFPSRCRVSIPDAVYSNHLLLSQNMFDELKPDYDYGYSIWRAERYYRHRYNERSEGYALGALIERNGIDSNFHIFYPYMPNHIPYLLNRLEEEPDEKDAIFLSALLCWDAFLQLYAYTKTPDAKDGTRYLDEKEETLPPFSRCFTPEEMDQIGTSNEGVLLRHNLNKELMNLFSKNTALPNTEEVLNRYRTLIGDECSFLQGDIHANTRLVVKNFLSYGILLFPEFLRLVHDADSSLFYVYLASALEDIAEPTPLTGLAFNIRENPELLLDTTLRHDYGVASLTKPESKCKRLLELWEKASPYFDKYPELCARMEDSVAYVREAIGEPATMENHTGNGMNAEPKTASAAADKPSLQLHLNGEASLSAERILSGEPISILLRLWFADGTESPSVSVRGVFRSIGALVDEKGYAAPLRPEEAWYPPTSVVSFEQTLCPEQEFHIALPLNRFYSTLLNPGKYFLKLENIRMNYQWNGDKFDDGWHEFEISGLPTLNFSIAPGTDTELRNLFQSRYSSLSPVFEIQDRCYILKPSISTWNAFTKYYEFVNAYGPTAAEYQIKYLGNVFCRMKSLWNTGVDPADRVALAEKVLFVSECKPYFFENDLLDIIRALRYQPDSGTAARIVDLIHSFSAILESRPCLKYELVHGAREIITALHLETEYAAFLVDTANTPLPCGQWTFLDMVNFPNLFQPARTFITEVGFD